ncbi:MAG: UPF0182 family protein, partial [Candidatus Woesearchaeota archaeon]|nr:UPF0182 family protein [Candidatus Woesearchaeota archaeon]
MGEPKNYLKGIFLTVVIIFFLSIGKLSQLYTDFLWFDALGFSLIFTKSLWAKITLFLITGIFFYIFVRINLAVASKFQSSKFAKTNTVIAVISLFVGLFSSSAWLTVLQYLNQTTFNLVDPILGKDAAFYVFSLPFFLFVWTFIFATLLLTTVVVAIFYFQEFIRSLFSADIEKQTASYDADVKTVYKSFDFKQQFSKIKNPAKIHLCVLIALMFLMLAVKHYLELFSVMFSEQGIVVGAGYTDVVIFLPAVKFLMIFAAIVAVVFFGWAFSKGLKKRHMLAFMVILYLLFTFIGQSVIPGIVQSLVVSPNEINLEKEYIENNIRFTNLAYGLDEVEEQDFAVAQNMTRETLENAKETIDNVRILDYRPLIKTYKQTQEIRLYYDLSGIDVDRYTINGKYTQVMLAPRELNQDQIASNAQTWVNLHMVYSHGFGVVMSPVNSVTTQGLPNYLIKDIPPVYTIEDKSIEVEEPRIYYGEVDNNYVLVNTDTEEFDFPKGSTNEYTQYSGKGGVTLSSFFRKLAMAIRFADVKILLSSDITPESKILFKRNIQERIQTLTPFFLLDSDPYLVIDEGKLFWIQDAYTATGNFPYSQKYENINYLRNAVKIVVDAYEGSITYYVIDTEDPIVKTYKRIFPDQFKPFDDMPLKDHIRYPEDLFSVQSAIYSNYHMNNPTVFYNKEDAWQIPSEVYGTGQKVEVEPYYIIMKLPGEEKEEFVLMTTFTPIKKDNMISWLAARSDGENYGKLLLYKFPKDKLIYGPLQIEARIDQDSEISQQLTLWSQQGSRVTRGNLLVIPIENNLLYIEPLYLQAETGQLPELKRVIVSDGERVVMEESLGDSLAELFGTARPVKIQSTLLSIKDP